MALIAIVMLVAPVDATALTLMQQRKTTTTQNRKKDDSKGSGKKGCQHKKKHNSQEVYSQEDYVKKEGTSKLFYSRDSRIAVETLRHAEGDKEAGGGIACQSGRREETTQRSARHQ